MIRLTVQPFNVRQRQISIVPVVQRIEIIHGAELVERSGLNTWNGWNNWNI